MKIAKNTIFYQKNRKFSSPVCPKVLPVPPPYLENLRIIYLCKWVHFLQSYTHQFQYFKMLKQLIDTWKKKLIRASMLHLLLFSLQCFICLTHINIPNKSFRSNQYHDITFLPQGLSNYSSFFSNFSRFTFQFFKSAESIFAQSPVRGHKYTLDQSLKVPQEKYGLYPHFGTIFSIGSSYLYF